MFSVYYAHKWISNMFIVYNCLHRIATLTTFQFILAQCSPSDISPASTVHVMWNVGKVKSCIYTALMYSVKVD